ncbi:MAG: MlaD family protein [Paludibacteraceae bacterium]
MNNNNNKTVRVGFFIASAIAIFVLAIYFIGSKNNLFNSKTKVICVFKDVKGVVQGNIVRFSGINVGNIKDITITSDSTVEIMMAIRKDYAQFIYKNSLVEISQDGLVGNKLLIISEGSANAGHIEENDTLKAKKGLDLDNLFTQVNKILASTESTIKNLDSITGKLKNGEGTIGELLTKNTLTSKLNVITDNLNTTLTNVNAITHKINSGQGDIGKLISRNDITDNAKSILTNLNQTSQKANIVVDELTKTTRSLNNGEGALSMLLNDKNTANNVDTTIKKAGGSLDQITHTLKALEGSWIFDLAGKKTKNYPTSKSK